LTFNLGDLNTITASTCVANCPVLQISNIYNPIYGGSYSVRVLVFGDGATFPNTEFNTTLVIPIPAFTTTTVGPVSNNANGYTALNVNVRIVDNLPAGIKNQPDPFVSYSYIEVWFQ
jgi:hypothetical protein